MLIFNIKSIRKKKNLTLYKMSELTGISRTYLRKLENNKALNPTAFILKKISEALNVNMKDLFYTELDLNNLKKEMYKRINKYGINSPEVLEISQIIDLLINVDMQEKKE